jgi:Arc/MetJ family transcription regulator
MTQDWSRVSDARGLIVFREPHSYIYERTEVYTAKMAKHLVDIDEAALAAAKAELGTASMKETVNEALRRASARRSARVQKALDRLGQRRLPPREEAWR